MSTMRPVLVAAGLLACGLSLATPVLACPGESAKKQAAMAAQDHPECAYMSANRSSGCCAGSFAGRLLAASVPAGLVAFGLGWLTGGRRRRDDQQA